MKNLLVFLLLIFSSVMVSAQKENEMLAKQYMETGELQKASDLYEKLYEQNNNAYYDPYFNCLLSLKKFNEAEDITKKMIVLHPQNYRFVIALGRIYKQSNEQAKADGIYNGLIEKMPADSATINNIATDFSRSNNHDYAIKAYKQGRKLLKNNRIFAWELSYEYHYINDKQDMVNELLTQLEVKPDYLSYVKRNISSAFDSTQDYSMLKTQLLAKIKQYPQQMIYDDLLTWQFLQQKQYDAAMDQAISLDQQYNDKGKNIYELCQTLVANAAYDNAIRGYAYIVSAGKKSPLYETAKIELINTKNLKITANKAPQAVLIELEKDYLDLLSEFGRTPMTASAMERLAHLQAFSLNESDKAEKNLTDLIAIDGLQGDSLGYYKLELGDVYLCNDRPWDATLMYSQVEKALPGTPVGEDAEYRNARLAYYTGDFAWAQEQLSVLKAETSQLIDNDALNLSLMIGDHTLFDSTANPLKMYARADLQIFKGKPEQAVIILDSINKTYPVNDLGNDILMAKARIFIQEGNYEAAANPLKKIVTESPTDLWADDAAFMLGDIYQNHLKDNAAAQNWYQKIILDYTSSLWVDEARKRFQILRDNTPPNS